MLGTETRGESHLTPNRRYASFMLRLQWMQNDDHPAWVASTQSTTTGELRWFPNLDALVQFIRDEFDDREDAIEKADPISRPSISY
jgi:hypothetical protein